VGTAEALDQRAEIDERRGSSSRGAARSAWSIFVPALVRSSPETSRGRTELLTVVLLARFDDVVVVFSGGRDRAGRGDRRRDLLGNRLGSCSLLRG